MALRILLLRKKLADKQNEAKTAHEALEQARAKKEALKLREDELAADIEEAKTDEEKAAVEAAMADYEKDDAEADAEIAAAEEAANSIDAEIAGIESEIAAVEKDAAPPKSEGDARNGEAGKEKRMILNKYDIRKMNAEERDAFFAREEVKEWMTKLREAIRDKRALTNAGLLIPETILVMLEQRIAEESKLIPFVSYHRRRGEGRAIVEGTIPEAVWTEMCANLNELTLAFNDVELDGYKVGGYIPVCNADLEDSDFDLADRVLSALGKAIGKAIDKAIVYGTGTKMPLGVVTRLAQTSQPAGYPATARTWADLHTSNILTGTGATGLNLIKEIVTRSGVADGKYGEQLIWLMNHKTHVAIMAEAVAANNAGLLVPGLRDEMPVVGGTIIELDFIPNNNVVFGYFDTYVLQERGEVRLEQSEHVLFTADKTVFKGTGRFDGQPAIAENFGLLTIVNTSPTTSVSFPEDSANPQ